VQLTDLALLVRDYDEAIAFYVGVLGFQLVEDTPMEGKRWVRLRAGACGLVLARAVTPEQLARVGDQTGERVFLFLRTDDFATDLARLVAHGVRLVGAPRDEPYGRVVVFHDLYGNKLDLIGAKA
jgi:catechol 2,3-dioxygenase-like lactoylglutathione lyase family enzyme